MAIIKVPATSANVGPGFDSFGIAVSLYLTLEIVGPADTWLIEHTLGDSIPTDQSNLIIETALSIAPALEPHHLLMKSDIPSARGLGSSSAAIVAGIELGLYLAELEWTMDQKVQYASKIEGHPDNVLPALVGDFAIGAFVEGRLIWTKAVFPETTLIVTIPNRELLTSESRSVLPEQLDYATAVKGSSVANVLISSVHQGDLPVVGHLMEQDVFHEPYRGALIPELETVRTIGHNMNAYGSYLSGAGTTVMTMVDREFAPNFVAEIKAALPDCTVKSLTIERVGSRIIQ